MRLLIDLFQYNEYFYANYAMHSANGMKQVLLPNSITVKGKMKLK